MKCGRAADSGPPYGLATERSARAATALSSQAGQWRAVSFLWVLCVSVLKEPPGEVTEEVTEGITPRPCPPGLVSQHRVGATADCL